MTEDWRGAHGRLGLTQRDVVVTVVVVGLFLLALLPYIYQRRLDAQRQFCQFRQWHVAQAVGQYESRFGHFPGYRNYQATDANGTAQATSWVFPILPFIHPLPTLAERPRSVEGTKLPGGEGGPPTGPYAYVYEQYGPDGPDALRGRRPRVLIKELVCPAQPPGNAQQQPNWMSVVVNTGMPDATLSPRFPADWPANGVFLDRYSQKSRSLPTVSVAYLEQHDGSDYTLMLSENVDCGRWVDVEEARLGFVWVAGFGDGVPDPADRVYRINQHVGAGDGSMRFARPSSYHPGGVNAVFCSGRTQFLSQEIDYLVFAQLMMCDSQHVMLPGTDQMIEPPYRVESGSAAPRHINGGSNQSARE